MAIWPPAQIYVSLYFLLSPLYCNTLLANLNARSFVRGSNFNVANGGSTDTYSLGPFKANSSAMTVSLPIYLEFICNDATLQGDHSVTIGGQSQTTQLSAPKFASNPELTPAKKV